MSTPEERRKPRASWPVRKAALAEQDDMDDLEGSTMEQRIEMVWPFTIDAWAMMGQSISNTRMQRHIVRILRRRK